MAVATAPRPVVDTAAASTSGGDAAASSSGARRVDPASITYRQYKDESDLPAVMALIDRDLSEPYSIFTYRYFLASWPELCFLAHHDGSGEPCGVVVCKMDVHRGKRLRGYLAMLVVDNRFRGAGIGSRLAKMSIGAMIDGGAEEVALEAEVTNTGALALYRGLGFIRDKRLHRYYLSGNDAFRLKLQLPLTDKEFDRRRREREAIFGVPEELAYEAEAAGPDGEIA
ncbi:MAG: acyl-CoA N-acyltransferase [Monoraphidium minutum]|nr:MAG: acyl-CoA N-acyltransferase [Monoraphidium minutum]